MPLITQPVLDFSSLKTPPEHGDVLVVPEPAAWVGALRANRDSLSRADVRLLDSTLAAWRRKTREAIIGSDDAFVIAMGHQPGFIHPGVWAKHVVGTRAAAAVDGVALNLVVDSDAPHQTVLPVPSVSDGRVSLRSIPFAQLPRGCAYEQIARQTTNETARLEQAVREAMADRYETSQMPVFFDAFSRATDAEDWVDQAVCARRALEAKLGVVVQDRRVSDIWYSPLLIDMLVCAERFAASYNKALRGYRRANRVRGARRPIPDLLCGDDRCEVAVWAYRAREPRRRLFVARAGSSLRVFAGGEEIGLVPVGHLRSCDDVTAVLADLNEWRLRPRALPLTIWARLLLADLFVHGIGGAKYDRISDAIMADYYGLAPPRMACASATLLMDLPRHDAKPEMVRGLRRAVRDFVHNPQRHPPHAPDVMELVERRAEAVQRARKLRETDRRNRQARRAAFTRIREINAAIAERRRGDLVVRQAALASAGRNLEQSRIAAGREYFFGLYDRARLNRLLDAVPTERDFRV